LLWTETGDLSAVEAIVPIATPLAVATFSIAELERIAPRDFGGGMATRNFGVAIAGGMELTLHAYPAGEVCARI
jgi:hypothetical protein